MKLTKEEIKNFIAHLDAKWPNNFEKTKAIAEELLELRQRGWKPIATIPNEDCLVYGLFGVKYSVFDYGDHTVFEGRYSFEAATHWMPLPKAPDAT